jgi:hypothetical protein
MAVQVLDFMLSYGFSNKRNKRMIDLLNGFLDEIIDPDTP